MLFGGRSSGTNRLDDINTGASNDIEKKRKTTRIAKLIVERVGMNPELGPIDYSNHEGSEFLAFEK